MNMMSLDHTRSRCYSQTDILVDHLGSSKNGTVVMQSCYTDCFQILY